MNDSQSNDPPSPEPPRKDVEGNDPATSGDSGKPKELTPEEQMALYEEDLKETDWGHQPC